MSVTIEQTGNTVVVTSTPPAEQIVISEPNGSNVIEVITRGPQGVPGQAAQREWIDYAAHWDTPPTFVSASVLGYTWESVTRYRFVPTPYTVSQDAFYSDLGLTQLIVRRGN